MAQIDTIFCQYRKYLSMSLNNAYTLLQLY